MRQNNCQQGSVLVFILIGVALFGMLMFSLTKGNGTSSSLSTKGSAKALASDILEYSRITETGVQRILNKGISENSVSFEGSGTTGYANAKCASDDCKVFTPSGGNISYRPPSIAALDTSRLGSQEYGNWVYRGDTCVYALGTDATVSCWSLVAKDMELVMLLPWVRKDVCLAINQTLNIANTSGNPPKIANSAYPTTLAKFIGTFTRSGHSIQSDGTNTATLKAKSEGCFEGATSPPTGSYTYYKVLIVR